MATLSDAKTLVLKIGSALLVCNQTGRLRMDWLRGLAHDIAAQRRARRNVIVVSSGSIALGRKVLDLPDGALSLAQSQAAAAVGQIQLAQAYETTLAPLGLVTAQVLLTRDDSADRRRYLNSRTTMQALLKLGVVPIVNENDTVATDEIRFGDNDQLAAQVAAMIGADHLILLSDIDGIYSGDPNYDPNAQHIPLIKDITPELETAAGGAASAYSKGGMRTKVMAAKTAMAAGCSMVIMKGDVDRPLDALANGRLHSRFIANQTPRDARKSWISSMKPKGELHLDLGAQAALLDGKSLLAVGVRAVSGQFGRGDVVAFICPDGFQLAKGLSAYNAQEAQAVLGKKSDEIAQVLGYAGRGPMVHRDDLAML